MAPKGDGSSPGGQLCVEGALGPQLGAQQAHPAAGHREGPGEKVLPPGRRAGKGHPAGQGDMGPEGPPGQGEARPLQPGGQLPLKGEQGGALLWEQRPQVPSGERGPAWENRRAKGGAGRAANSSPSWGARGSGVSPKKARVRCRVSSPG